MNIYFIMVPERREPTVQRTLAPVSQNLKPFSTPISAFIEDKEFEGEVCRNLLVEWLLTENQNLPKNGILNFSPTFVPHLSTLEKVLNNLPEGKRPLVVIFPKNAQAKVLFNLSAFIEAAHKGQSTPRAEMKPRPISETTKKELRGMAAVIEDSNVPIAFPAIWILAVSDESDPIACTVFPTSSWLKAKSESIRCSVVQQVREESMDLSWGGWTEDLPTRIIRFCSDTNPPQVPGQPPLRQTLAHLERRFLQVQHYLKSPYFAGLSKHPGCQSLVREMQDVEKLEPLYMAYERSEVIDQLLTEVEEMLGERTFLLSLAKPFLEKAETAKRTERFLTASLADPRRHSNDGIISEWNRFKAGLEKQ